jgi:hypothetical protein
MKIINKKNGKRLENLDRRPGLAYPETHSLTVKNNLLGVSLTIEKQMKCLKGDNELKLGSFYNEIQRVKKKQLRKKRRHLFS